ncbi:hypothetical protein ACRRTK_009125 [Alexandromys fortis]
MLASNRKSSCINFPSAGVTGVYHHIQRAGIKVWQFMALIPAPGRQKQADL